MLAKILKYVILNPLPACVGMVFVRVALCSVLYGIVYCICICLIKVGKSTELNRHSLLKKKKKKKNPARYVISIQISGERTAAAYVITVFTL